jgi:hypothetical protein
MRRARPRRLRKVLAWGAFLLAAILAGGLTAAYWWATDSGTLRGLIQSRAARYFPGSRLEMSGVELRPGLGLAKVFNLALVQKLDDAPHMVARIPWVQVTFDPAAIVRGKFIPGEVVLAQPNLRLKQRKDGTWNLQGLLADPLPDAGLPIPKVRVQAGTIELIAPDEQPAALLRDVALTVEPSPGGGLVHFEGTARGGSFEQLRLEGTVERGTGIVILRGGLDRLALSETLRKQLPPAARDALTRIGLSGGELDATLSRLNYDPSTKSLTYQAALTLRSATIASSAIPFPLSDVSARISVQDGQAVLQRAMAHNGKTTLLGSGTFALDPSGAGPFDLAFDVLDLELDERLRGWLPPKHRKWWDEWFGEPPGVAPGDEGRPRSRGRINLAARARRAAAGAPPDVSATIDCRDVDLAWKAFPYPFSHVNGVLTWQGTRLDLDLSTPIGGKPARVKGFVDRPGRDANAELEITADALPLDDAFVRALPVGPRGWVEQFHPVGTISGNALLIRRPPPPGEEKGPIEFHATIDLMDRCAIRWEGLPYPIEGLTGRLKIHPNLWTFEGMKGRNGQAQLTGSGKVERVDPGPKGLALDIQLAATNLAFDRQLRSALPEAWNKTWATLNPSGACDATAHIIRGPEGDHDRFVIRPRGQTRVQLELPPWPGLAASGGPPEPIRLPPMEEVRGTFAYNDGVVTMTGVGFEFHSAPVRVETGRVQVADNGAFDLQAEDLAITGLRLDAGLRRLMPPLMAQFSRRLNDEPLPLARGNLRIGWAGKPGEPAGVSWSEGLLVLNGNTIQTGLPLQHLQGQIERLSGAFDGRELRSSGFINLESVTIKGLQVTKLRAPFHVGKDRVGLPEITAELFNGRLAGRLDATIADEPRYSVRMNLRDADLRRYAMTVPGAQKLKGLLTGELICSGTGEEIRSIQGYGWARVAQGDLGEIPAFLNLMKVLRLNLNRLDQKSAFDSAELGFRIEGGVAWLDPIKIRSDAVSLEGTGSLDPRGEVDVRLHALLGRDDRPRVPVVGDLLREAGSQFLIVRLRGRPSDPKVALEPLPQATNAVRSLGEMIRPQQERK